MSLDLPSLWAARPVERRRSADLYHVSPDEYPTEDSLSWAIAQAWAYDEGLDLGRGVLEIHGEGFGFLRSAEHDFRSGPDDIYVSQSQIRRFQLQTGDSVVGRIRPPKEGERYAALLRVELINGRAPERGNRPNPHIVMPFRKVPAPDLIVQGQRLPPLHLGARGVVVGPQRLIREAVLPRLVEALVECSKVAVLLPDHRPEGISVWRENPDVEVYATDPGEGSARHLQLADIVFARAMRLAERGQDVSIVVDSLTRLFRHAQAEHPSDGRQIEGLSAHALNRLRGWMAGAGQRQEAGSVTILGTMDPPINGRSAEIALSELDDLLSWRFNLSKNESQFPTFALR